MLRLEGLLSCLLKRWLQRLFEYGVWRIFFANEESVLEGAAPTFARLPWLFSLLVWLRVCWPRSWYASVFFDARWMTPGGALARDKLIIFGTVADVD